MWVEKVRTNVYKVENDERLVIVPSVFIRAESREEALNVYDTVYREHELQDFGTLAVMGGRTKIPVGVATGLKVGPVFNLSTLAPLHDSDVEMIVLDEAGENEVAVKGKVHMVYYTTIDLSIDYHVTKHHMYKPQAGDICLLYDEFNSGAEMWFTPEIDVELDVVEENYVYTIKTKKVK